MGFLSMRFVDWECACFYISGISAACPFWIENLPASTFLGSISEHALCGHARCIVDWKLMCLLLHSWDRFVSTHLVDWKVVLLSGPSLAFWGVIIWAKFVFYKTLFVKNTIKIGVSAPFWKNCARKFEVLLSGPSWPFLSCSQLGPDNNTYLAQIITPQNAFFVFFALKCAEIPIFIVFCEHQPKFGKKGAKKTITFHILQNTGS